MKIIRITTKNIESLQNSRGTYILEIELHNSENIAFRVNKSKQQKQQVETTFLKGTYYYVGSALGKNGLYNRVKRHFSIDKNKRWHIDYLLTIGKLVRAYCVVWSLENTIKEDSLTECNIANFFELNGIARVDGFGCSDCKCKSHLFYVKSKVNKPNISKLIGNINSCMREQQ